MRLGSPSSLDSDSAFREGIQTEAERGSSAGLESIAGEYGHLLLTGLSEELGRRQMQGVKRPHCRLEDKMPGSDERGMGERYHRDRAPGRSVVLVGIQAFGHSLIVDATVLTGAPEQARDLDIGQLADHHRIGATEDHVCDPTGVSLIAEVSAAKSAGIHEDDQLSSRSSLTTRLA